MVVAWEDHKDVTCVVLKAAFKLQTELSSVLEVPIAGHFMVISELGQTDLLSWQGSQG